MNSVLKIVKHPFVPMIAALVFIVSCLMLAHVSGFLEKVYQLPVIFWPYLIAMSSLLYMERTGKMRAFTCVAVMILLSIAFVAQHYALAILF
ncbi:hypothetical protein M1466_03140 [Candidatus Dependentiae bacterium]|nr:hypothetical protein [Candidatus Dependentiae bacterium]